MAAYLAGFKHGKVLVALSADGLVSRDLANVPAAANARESDKNPRFLKQEVIK